MIYKLLPNRVSRSYLGGKKISAFCGVGEAENGYYPEDWTASVVCSAVDENEGLGKTEDGKYVKDIVSGEMKCLVKLLDSAERLVIQVHPTIEFAKKYFSSEYGKTEMWYFLDCDDDAYIYAGFKSGITKEAWEKAFYEQNVSDMLGMLHKIPVKSGESIIVRGGMPHAIGKGCFMIEIQEPTDLMGVAEKVTPSGRKLSDIRIHGGIGEENMLKMFEYSGADFDENLKKCRLVPKMTDENVYEIADESVTDKFFVTLLKKKCSYTPKRKNGVAVICGGSGRIGGITAKKGDRFFFNDSEPIAIEGSDDFNVVICC